MGPEGGKALSSLCDHRWHWILASTRQYCTQCFGMHAQLSFPQGCKEGKCCYGHCGHEFVWGRQAP